MVGARPVAGESAPPASRSSWRAWWGGRTATALKFLAPLLVTLALTAGWPLLRTILLGFTDANLLRPGEVRFVGFDNYLRYSEGRWRGILADPVWWRAVQNTVVFAVVSVALETLLGLALAMVLDRRFRGRAFVRAAVLVPWAIPTIVSAKIWSWMLNDQFGVINYALLGLGLIEEPIAFTAESALVLPTVIAVDVWKTTPFMALLILAGLQMVPKDCYEAAAVDGIPPLQVFFRITLPLALPAIVVAVIFRFLDAMRIFDLIYVLTSNAESSMTMSVYARQQLVEFQEIGPGSAASTLLFLIIGLATTAYIRLLRARGQEV